MNLRTPCSPVDRQSLLAAIAVCMNACLDACGKVSTDLAGVEQAVAIAVEEFTKRMRQAGTDEAMSQPLPWWCPDCKQLLGYHDTQRKSVVLRQGLVELPRGRYRCGACGGDHLPVDVLNDLEETGFSLGAREVGVTEAVKLAFVPASAQVKPRLPVSAKSLERMVAEAAGWRQQEQADAVGAFYGDRAKPGLLPTGSPRPLVHWAPGDLPKGAVLCISADGGFVRSTTKGKDGKLEWFEARVGTISVTHEGKELPPKVAGGKFYLAGTLELDDLFEVLGVTYETLPPKLKALPSVFTGDGGHWWERRKEHFPQAKDILDLYHAGDHLGSAAAICFGDGSAKTRQWREHAREWLMQPGQLEERLGELIRGRPCVKEYREAHHKLLNHIAYFREHRHRMRYWEYEAQGLPLGSGVIESGVKQTVAARARQAGMKWTREHAHDMLCLRAAYLSHELPGVFRRRREACLQKARRFCETLQLAA